MIPRTIPFAACIGASVTLASALEAAPGVYPTEAAPSAIPASAVVSPGSNESLFRADGEISVLQRVADSGPVSVPICIDGAAVGHAYAVKSGSIFRAVCRTSAAVPGQAPPPAVLVKPTRAQGPSVYWVPFQKGGGLPRTLAPLSIDSRGVSLYACKANLGTSEHVGTLLPTGECRLAPSLGGGAGGGRVEAASMVLVRGGSGGANASPAYGWIYPKRGGHHPGGTLLKWQGTASVFCRGSVQGTSWYGRLETNPDGSVLGCLVTPPGATMTTSDDLAVFRNDTTSNVEFARSAPASVAWVSVGGRVPCVLEVTREKLHFGHMEGDRCKTPTYLQLRNEYLPYYELVRRGAWPDQG